MTWKRQLDNVINRAYRAFWTCRGTFGKTWGLRPQVMYWIYTVVVRPIVTYAATVWWPRMKYGTSRAELTKLQRMACLGITAAIRTTPTAALEVLLGLICSWKPRPEQGSIDCTAMSSGNLNPKVLDMRT
jgi:hypothetical protein